MPDYAIREDDLSGAQIAALLAVAFAPGYTRLGLAG